MAIGTEIPLTTAATAFSIGAGVCWTVFTIVENRTKAMIKASRKAHEVAYHGRVDNDEN